MWPNFAIKQYRDWQFGLYYRAMTVFPFDLGRANCCPRAANPIERFPRGPVFLLPEVRSAHRRRSPRALRTLLADTPVGRELCRCWKEWGGTQIKKYEWNIDPEDADHPRTARDRHSGQQGCEVDRIANDIGMSQQNVRYFRDQTKAGADGRKCFLACGQRRSLGLDREQGASYMTVARG
jgi:hypothetical protein